MNRELKRLLQLSIGLLFILIFFLNLFYYLNNNNFIASASKANQIISSNRLRSPNVKHSSEKWSYPQLNKKDHLKLVALKKQNKILVLNTDRHKVIYTLHAKINIAPQKKPLHILYARGQEIYHIHGARHTNAQNWLGISKGHYIETPVTDLGGHPVSRNLLKAPSTIKNTIYVSRPDAKWLQGVPENTPLIIKEGN